MKNVVCLSLCQKNKIQFNREVLLTSQMKGEVSSIFKLYVGLRFKVQIGAEVQSIFKLHLELRFRVHILLYIITLCFCNMTFYVENICICIWEILLPLLLM